MLLLGLPLFRLIGLILASFVGLLLICLALLLILLLLPILIRLLLRRRRTVIASWLPLTRSIRLRCVAGLVRIVRRCVGRLSRVAHCRLTVRRLIVRPVSVGRCRFSWRCLFHLWALRRNICRAHSLDFTPRERLTGMRRQLLLLFCERHGWRRWRRFCYHGTLYNRLRRFRGLIGG
ncbi:MAG: hypothetical protein DMG80_01505 [Acidobacteria bacterium]|nr:MAG: hypothetical protein DMG80_01505 [Acidobacteriota bacterium]